MIDRKRLTATSFRPSRRSLLLYSLLFTWPHDSMRVEISTSLEAYSWMLVVPVHVNVMAITVSICSGYTRGCPNFGPQYRYQFLTVLDEPSEMEISRQMDNLEVRHWHDDCTTSSLYLHTRWTISRPPSAGSGRKLDPKMRYIFLGASEVSDRCIYSFSSQILRFDTPNYV